MSQDLVVAKARWWAKYPKQAGAEIGDAFSRFQKVMTELYGSHVWVLGAGGRSEVSPDEFRRRWTSEVFPTGNPDDQSLIAVWERFTLTLELVQMGGQFPFDLETISSLLSALRHGGACFDDDENMPSLESGELNCLHNKMVGQIIKLQRWADVNVDQAVRDMTSLEASLRQRLTKAAVAEAADDSGFTKQDLCGFTGYSDTAVNKRLKELGISPQHGGRPRKNAKPFSKEQARRLLQSIIDDPGAQEFNKARCRETMNTL